MQRRVAGHESFDCVEVVGVDGLLELPGLFKQIDVNLELGPTSKSIETRDLELRLGQ